jgi:hypothetical protein
MRGPGVAVAIASILLVPVRAEATTLRSVPRQTAAQAQVHVLLIVARSWNPARIPNLVDPRTRTIRTNTQAVCRGRGKPVRRRYSRFVCIVRPARHRRGEGLYLSYRVLARGRSVVHWLRYQTTAK